MTLHFHLFQNHLLCLTTCITIHSMPAVSCAVTYWAGINKHSLEFHYAPVNYFKVKVKVKKTKQEWTKRRKSNMFKIFCQCLSLYQYFRYKLHILYEIKQFVSDNLSDCQMSHCFLFVISQVENDRAQAPEKSCTKEVFHGVHLKCYWLDALSTAKG